MITFEESQLILTMGFFKKITGSKKKSSVQKEDQAIKTSASTPTRSISDKNPSTSTPKSSDKKSPFKRIGRVFGRKKEIKLKSPDVKEGSGDGKQTQHFYTTNTDGYEVILEGKQLEFQSDPLFYEDGNQRNGTTEIPCNATTFCAEDACAPLSDFPTFLSLLFAPNMDEIKKFVFGDTTKNKQIISPPPGEKMESKTKASMEVSPPLAEVVSQSASSSLPFDEGLNRSVSIMDEDESTIDNDGMTVDQASSYMSQPEDKSKQKAVPIPMNKKDAPTYRSPKNGNINYSSSKSTPDLSDEEMYDSAFTLRFLRVGSFECCIFCNGLFNIRYSHHCFLFIRKFQMLGLF